MNILGDIETDTSTGYVTLTVAGKEVRMLPVDSGRRLWFIMRDLTSSDDTYPAARFLYADAPDADGWTTVDFNMAYDPPARSTRTRPVRCRRPTIAWMCASRQAR